MSTCFVYWTHSRSMEPNQPQPHGIVIRSTPWRQIVTALSLVTLTVSMSGATAAQETVQLDPFTVTTTATKGYEANNTISGTAMNELLKNVPMTINVITSEFLSDALVGHFEDALDHSSSVTQTNRGLVTNRGGSWAMRGFRTRNTLIDGVQGGETIPRWLIDRIEIVKGPNTLYGQADPGGLINVITKRPLIDDRTTIDVNIGTDDLYEGSVDVSRRTADKRIGVRVLGAYEDYGGWRRADGLERKFAGFMGELDLTKRTTLSAHVSTSRTDGIPGGRGARSFMDVRTDLNGDGDTNDRVGGVPEANARFNADFLPRDYTTATIHNKVEQENLYLQLSARQRLGERIVAQYKFVRTKNDIYNTFREFNTFSVAGTAPGLHQEDIKDDETTVHSLYALLTLETVKIFHRVLAGARLEEEEHFQESWRLRSNNAPERAILQGLINSGRRVRLDLTKDDVLAGTPIWLDGVPTAAEMRASGSRTNNLPLGIEEVRTFFLTDSMSLANDRLKLLAGVRHVGIKGRSHNIQGVVTGRETDSSDFSYQVGGVFHIVPTISVFTNLATAHEPNSTVDSTTGEFYDPQDSRAWEVGLKFDNFWKGRIGGSLAYFNIKKSNVIRNDFNPATSGSLTEVTDDAAEGFDAELFFNITDNWNTRFNYTYLDAKVINSRTEAAGMRLEGAAPHRMTFWTSYAINKGPLRRLRFGGGFLWAEGSIPQFGTSSNRLVAEDGYTEINLFARYTAQMFGKRMTFGLNVKNLNDVTYIRARAAVNNPRQIVFSIKAEL